jgi:hypothetical protein
MAMKTELKFAVIYVVASFVWSCVEYLTGLQSTRIGLHPYFVTPFYILLTGAVYYLAIREKRASLSGKLGFGKALVTGLILSVLILALNPIAFYIFNTFVNPEFFRDMGRYKIETENMPREIAEGYYNFNNLLVQGSIYRLVMGLIATFITSWLMKKA